MVAKIISGKSMRGLLNYNENKVTEGQAKLILASRFGTEIDRLDYKAKLNRFEYLTMLRPDVKTNAIHIMLNFDRQDKVDLAAFQQIAGAYMDKIGFGDQPYLVYQHQDVSHPHIHIVTTNIKPDGKRIDIHGIGWTLSETARKELEIEFNLVKAEDRKQSETINIEAVDIEKAVYGKMPTKRSINNVVSAVMRNYKFTSLAEYNAVLKEFNVIADRGKEDSLMFEKRGLVYSIIDRKGNRVGIPFKASDLTNRPILDQVEKKFVTNEVKRKPYKEKLTTSIDKVLARYEQLSKGTLLTELKASNIGLLFRQNDQGLIYGVTFIDHQYKTVFNGSDLGKAYSAKALTERLSREDKLKTYLKPATPTQSYLKPSTETTYLQPASPTNYLETLSGKPQPDIAPSTGRKKKKRNRGITR